MAKYLDENGLVYAWGKAKSRFADKTELPKNTSDITNDSGYITINDVPEGAKATLVTPSMNGAAATGTDEGFARGDHVHPTDTSRAAAADLEALQGVVDTKADASAVNTLTETVSGKADKATTADGYGITDVYTKTQVDTELGKKADSGTTIASYGISDAYTKDEVDSAIDSAITTSLSSVMNYKGTCTYAELPTDAKAGDTWNVSDAHDGVAAGTNWSYNGESWDALSGAVDLSGYQPVMTVISNAELDTILV